MDVIARNLHYQTSEEMALGGEQLPLQEGWALSLRTDAQSRVDSRTCFIWPPHGSKCLNGWPSTHVTHRIMLWIFSHTWRAEFMGPKIRYLVFSAPHTRIFIFLLSSPPAIHLSCLSASGRYQRTTFIAGDLSLCTVAKCHLGRWRYCWQC